MTKNQEDKYLGFLIPNDLHQEIEELIVKMRNTANKKQYAMEIYNMVVKLSNVGLDYFFIEPLTEAKIGMLKMKSVKVALNTGKRGMFAVAKTVLKGMNDDQLALVIQLFERSITVRPEEKNT